MVAAALPVLMAIFSLSSLQKFISITLRIHLCAAPEKFTASKVNLNLISTDATLVRRAYYVYIKMGRGVPVYRNYDVKNVF